MTGIYRERAVLLALLTLHYPSHVTPATDPEPGFTHVVCIHVGGAQHAWHIADEDFHLFVTLPRTENHWDGHTTEQKYASLETVARVTRPKGWPE